MRRRHERAVRADVVEAAVERARADRALLDDLERPEGARERDLEIVGHVLVAEDEDRVLFERGADRAVGGIAARDVQQADAADLRSETGSEWNNLHCVSPALAP